MRFLILAVVVFCSSALRAEGNIPYVTRDGSELFLDIHLPEKSGEELYPTILWIHGGGWRQGSKENWKLLDWLPKNGFAVVSIDYRLTNTAPFPAQIYDCVSALNWIGKHGREHKIDTERLYVAGLSAGAHLASLLGTSGNHFAEDGTSLPSIRGILHFFGPCDFISMMKYAKQPTDTLNTDKSPVYGLLGGPLRENESLAREASPVSYLDATDPPLLILVGTADSLMAQRQCKRLNDLAQATGITSSIHTIEGAGHGGPEFKDATRQKLILQFLTSS